MQSIAETCVRFDAAHLSINLVSEIAVPMFTTLRAGTSSLDAIFGRVQVNISRSEDVFETFHHYCL